MSKPLYAYLRGIPSTPAILFNVCVPVCIACIHNQRRISAFFLCGSLAYYLEMGSLIEPEISIWVGPAGQQALRICLSLFPNV